MVAIFLLAIIACSSKSGDTPASSSSSIVNYAQITAPSTPVVLGAAESDGSESLILVGNKDSSGNPTSINGVGYSSSKNGQFYFVIDSSSGLPISITDSFGNKMIFSNYTATSAQVSIYNNNVLISGPSQVTFNSSTLSQVQSLWSTISGSLSSASPNIKSSSTRSIKSSSTQNLDTFLIQYAGEVVGLASCATYVTTGGLAIPLVLTCGSAIVGAVDLVTGNETLNTISTFSDVTSCGVDLVSMDVQGLMDCPLAITDFLSNNQNPLPVPSGLTLLSSPTQINLSWNASTDSRVIGYNVYRITSAGVYSKLQSTSQTAAIDTDLQSSTQYCYLISDYDSSGSESLHSDSVCITTPSSGSSVATTLTISGQVLLNGTGLSRSDCVSCKCIFNINYDRFKWELHLYRSPKWIIYSNSLHDWLYVQPGQPNGKCKRSEYHCSEFCSNSSKQRYRHRVQCWHHRRRVPQFHYGRPRWQPLVHGRVRQPDRADHSDRRGHRVQYWHLRRRTPYWHHDRLRWQPLVHGILHHPDRADYPGRRGHRVQYWHLRWRVSSEHYDRP